MPLSIFGAQATVSMVNRALSSTSVAHKVFQNQVVSAGTTVATEYAFALQLGVPHAVGKTPDALAAQVLDNLGISAETIPEESFDILLTAVTDYIDFHGTHNIGIIALQLGRLLSVFETDETFGDAARAWNQQVLSAYNYSSNPASTTPLVGEAAPGQSRFNLVVGQDLLTGTDGDDTFIANVVQNAQGQQVNTLGSGDILDGGEGFDVLAAKVTNGLFGNSVNMPVQAETLGIEHIQLQAALSGVDPSVAHNSVFVNARDMQGVQTLSSHHSDASLTVMSLGVDETTLSDLRIQMSHTGNADSSWNQSDFKVLFDQADLTAAVNGGGGVGSGGNWSTTSIEFLAMNEDNYDASEGANPLEGVFFRTLNFTLNGEALNLAEYLGEDPAGAGDEIKTYEDFLAAVESALEALKAAHPDNAALQTVTASLGRQFTTDVNPDNLELREGTAIRLTVEGETRGKDNILTVASTDLEIARTAKATVPNNNRYEIAGPATRTEGESGQNSYLDAATGVHVGIHVDLEKVGRGGDGGALVIGSMNKGDDTNVWNATHALAGNTTNGINAFWVTVKGGGSQSSSLSELRSTNNQLKVVTVATDEDQTDSFAHLTIGNSNTAGDRYENALKDVKIFDASAFKGDLSLKAALTSEVVAKYLDLQDQAPAAAEADNAAFVYTGGAGNDTIDLQLKGLTAEELTMREDLSVNLVGGEGDDELTLTVVDDAGAAVTHWYANQTLNDNLRIHGGEGNDTIRTPGSGNVTIDAGEGSDTVYADNEGAKAVWVLNAVANQVQQGDIESSVNDTYRLYKGSVTVGFLGFEASASVVDVRGVINDRAINQAVKQAINGDATLSKLLEAKDGPANTLVVTSRIDGEVVADALSVTLQAPATLTNRELDQLDTWYGEARGTTTVVSNQDAAAAFNDPANTTYLTQMALDGVNPVQGSDSTHIADHVITGGMGDDVLILGTGADSNDMVKYAGDGNGTDSIVNFTADNTITGLTSGITVEVTTPGSDTAAVVFTATFAATPTANTYAFNGVQVTVAPEATAAEIAAAFMATSFTGWTVAAGATSEQVQFTATSVGAVTVTADNFSAMRVADDADFIDFSAYGATAVYIDTVLVAGADTTKGQTYITLTESTDDQGVYTVQKSIDTGASGRADGAVAEDAVLIGVLDFGATQAFTGNSFIL